MIRIDRLEASVYRYPLATPVQTSFGLMRDRPMVVVKLTGRDGVVGWGEIWCNFPNVGAEHRARLAEHVIAPILLARDFDLGTQQGTPPPPPLRTGHLMLRTSTSEKSGDASR